MIFLSRPRFQLLGDDDKGKPGLDMGSLFRMHREIER